MATMQVQQISLAAALAFEPAKEADADLSSASTTEPASRSRADSAESLDSVESAVADQQCAAPQAVAMMPVSYMLVMMPDGRQCWMPVAMPMGMPTAMPVPQAPPSEADVLAARADALAAQAAAAKAAAKEAKAAAKAAREQAREDERRRLRLLIVEQRSRKAAGISSLNDDASTVADSGSEADESSYEDDGEDSAFDL